MPTNEVGLRVVLEAQVAEARHNVDAFAGQMRDMATTAVTAARDTARGLSTLNTASTMTAQGLSDMVRQQNIAAQALRTTLSPAINTNGNAIQFLVAQARAGQISYGNLGDAAMRAGAAISRGTTNASSSANRSANTLQNLGRVASDLPFGFIAIQNNLDPLFESFRRLSAETGSAGKALKALGASLIGPAGIALAFTAVTSTMTFLIQKYGSLSNALTVLNPFIDLATKNTILFNKAQVDGAKQIGPNIAQLMLLYKATQDTTLSMDERRKVVDKLQEQYPETFKNLSDEAILTGRAAAGYDKLREALLAQATIRASQDLIGAQIAKVIQLGLETENTKKKIADIQKQIGNQANTNGTNKTSAQYTALAVLSADTLRNTDKTAEAQTTINQILDQQLALVKKFGVTNTLQIDPKKFKSAAEVTAELNKALSDLDTRAKLSGDSAKSLAQDKIQVLTKAFDAIQQEGSPAAQGALVSIGAQMKALQPIADATTKHVKTVSEIMKTLSADLDVVNSKDSNLGLSPDATKVEQIKALEKAFTDLTKIGLSPTSAQVTDISNRIANLNNQIIGTTTVTSQLAKQMAQPIVTVAPGKKLQTPEEFAKTLGLDNFQSALKFDVHIQPNYIYETTPGLIKPIAQAQAEFNAGVADFTVKASKQITDAMAAINALVQSAPADAVSSLADTVGKALTGGNIGDALSGFVDTISSFLTQMGKLLIVQGFAVEAFKTSLASLQGIGAIAAGAALIAASAAFKSLAGKGVTSYATGGVVTSPQLALIGDNPARKEAVVPSELWDKMGGGLGSDMVLTTKIKGSDLLVAVQRAGREFNRFN